MHDLLVQRMARLDEAWREHGCEPAHGAWRRTLERIVLASDFAFEALRREPPWAVDELPAQIVDTAPLAQRAARVDDPDDASASAALRALRRRENVRLIARDVLGYDSVEATLAGSTALAEHCLSVALAHAGRALSERFGTPRSAAGEVQQLVIIGMGKLGGAELNFSSDVDLIFTFAEAGETDGARVLANEDYFVRLGQRVIQLLSEVTAEGFCQRVDMRLRPFGSVGRMALSFAAMEQYYQREGRDWERYAWIKARPVAGDVAAGERLLAQLRPFVYRRYLDFTAIDGLREMKRLIDAEVERRELAQHIKLGPGGIRELEFMVQLVQLVRGGREPRLRTASFAKALAVSVDAGFFAADQGARLSRAYAFLRRLENRLQMLRDEQTHELPDDALTRARIAISLGYANWDELVAALDAERDIVARAFAETLQPERTAPVDAARDWQQPWRALLAGQSQQLPEPFGASEASAALAGFAQGALVRALDARARARLDALLPELLEACARSRAPQAALQRVAALLAAIVGRPTYLALLHERPAARERLIDVCARSAWLAERVCAHPLLLDDLLDARVSDARESASVAALFARARAGVEAGDVEQELAALVDVRQSVQFRLGLQWLTRGEDADDTARALAGLADATLNEVLSLAWRENIAQCGALPDCAPGAGFAVLGYGSLGGAELGFASDLDLVFVYDAAFSDVQSAGPRMLEGSRWFARLAQRIVHWLTTPARAGALYAVDMRLRPDGAKGLLVTTADAFAEYQRERAWVWEHQALVRARVCAGDVELGARCMNARASVLMGRRDPAALCAEVARMRERWRAELDRGGSARFDLKQGRGGLVDLEFLLQALVLEHSHAHPALLASTRTRDVLHALHEVGVLGEHEGAALAAAHDALLARALDCTLDAKARVVPCDAELDAHAEAIAHLWGRCVVARA
jgi:glutamate-ammonia-ligase adenylyltransferase